MRNQKRLHLWLRRLGQLSLAVALLCAMALSARADGQAEIPQPVIPKPVVTVQGNLVVDNGKPTGFYELALCVRSGRTIVETASNSEVTEADYAADIAATPDHATDGTYTITYYPFRTVAGTVNINTDVLTPVSWNLSEVIYGTWDKTSGQYTDGALNTASTARGIDLTATLDPDLYPDVDPDIVKSYITDVTSADLNAATPVSVRLEAAGDPQMTNVTAQADHYTADPVNPENSSTLVTLSAATTDNKSVIFKTDTPVVVVRFAYDLNRFSGLTTVNTAVTGGGYNSITGDTTDPGFWLGGDANDRAAYGADKIPLTWLAKSDAANVANPYADADQQAAATRNHQVVWYSAQCGDKAELDKETTQFYYYLGANGNQQSGSGPVDILVETPTDPFATKKVTLPRTTGYKVLTADPNGLDPAGEGYTYFQNLLKFNDGSLKLKLVNAPTFRKPAGKGGTMVLFYDWDNSFLGSMLIGKGDVRSEVNEYVEKNMVHPDLRASQYLEGGNIPTDPTKLAEHQNLTDSLDREYTYRGKYSSKVDGSGVTRPDDPDPTASWANDDPTTPGSEYKLTNKLDYVFYRHIDTVTTLDYTDASGSTVQERYITSAPLSSDPEAALYPWVYGWAVVEDNSVRNLTNWQSRRDAAKVEDVWTTFGTAGELDGLSPAYDLAADAKGQSVPTSLPSGATPPASGTGITTTYPAFMDTSAVTAPTVYSYALTGVSGYLRMADFSDAQSLLTRDGQDTIIVKAVYEPGTELQEANYSIEEVPYYNRLNDKAASEGGAYSAVITLERANNLLPDGYMRGCMRMRDPAVRQDTTLDQKWIADEDRGVNNDLSNPSIQTAKDRLETTYAKVDTDNGEQITFTLALSARYNKVDYFLTEMYGYNFVAGGQRSDTNYNQYGLSHAIDNYNYLTNTTDDALNDNYYDKQGVYYQAARYEVREGTHGFVLYGTLNYLMEQATRVNTAELSRADFNSGTGYMTFRDVNLWLDNGTTKPSIANQNTIRDAVIKAAAECMYNHYGDPDFWNSDLDCAELTYHQLQHYLTSGTLMTRAAADAATIDWCHLHKACFKDSEAAEAPKTWDEVLAAAADADKAKRDAISLLSGSLDGNIETITGLRSSINGDAFTSGKSFQDKIVKAVSDLNTAGRALTWANVQYAILYNAAPPSDAAGQNAALAAYWWYGGAKTKPSGAASLAELAEAAKDYEGVELKDGSTVGGWRFKLNGVDTAYADMYTGSGSVGEAWVALTENLVHHVTELPDGDQVTTSFYEEQSDYTLFEPTLLDALKLAADAGADPTDQANFWPRLQYVLIHSATTWPTAIPGDGSAEGTEMENYWWRNDGKFMIVKDAQTMFSVASILADPNPPADAAAQKQRDAAQAAWDKFDAARFADAAFGIFSNLRTTFDASGLPADDFAAFKAQVIAFVGSGLVPDVDPTSNPDLWDQFQYYLVHNGTYDNLTMISERSDGRYWWKDGGTSGTPVTIKQLNHLAIAGFSSKINGNTAAWDNLTQSWINDFYFRAPDVASDTDGDGFYLDADQSADASANDHRYSKHTDMPELSTAALQAAVEALVQNWYDQQMANDPTGHYHSAPTLTWLDIQHYIVTGGDTDWTDEFADEAAAQSRYWWHSGGPNPHKEVKTAVQSMLEELQGMGSAALKALTAAQAVSQVAPKLTNGEVSMRVLPTTAAIAGPNAKTAATRLATLMDNVAAAGDDFTSLTWYQVQYALFPTAAAQGMGGNGKYQPDPAVARAWYINNLTPAAGGSNTAGKFKADWRPAWLIAKEGAGAMVASLDALEDLSALAELPADLPQDEPSADDPAADADDPVGAGSKPAREETLDDLLAQKAELERQLAQLEERIAAMEEEVGAGSKPARDETTPETPAEPEDPVAPSEPVTPAEPEAPETPETPEETTPETPVIPEPDYAERSEIPLGDEVAGLTWTRAALPAADRLLPGRLDALLPKYLTWRYVV